MHPKSPKKASKKRDDDVGDFAGGHNPDSRAANYFVRRTRDALATFSISIIVLRTWAAPDPRGACLMVSQGPVITACPITVL
jgi:hypothetical protein